MSLYTAGLCASLLVLHQFYSFSRHPLQADFSALLGMAAKLSVLDVFLSSTFHLRFFFLR
ncbi:MAG: hypothetical protein K2W99_04380 [Chthoniobacterales bacterium]|nr:hypothetical protein [Chthoniobacterales bacterium]